MKAAQFNFLHPVKGHVCITRLPNQEFPGYRRLAFDTGESNELTIPLHGFAGGKWKIILEWEYEDRCYAYSMEIDLPVEKKLLPGVHFSGPKFCLLEKPLLFQ